MPSEEYIKSIRECASEIYSELGFKEGDILISGVTGMIGTVMTDCFMTLNDEFHTAFRVTGISRNRVNAKERLGLFLDRKDFRYIECDINYPIPDIGKADYVIHAASNTHPIAYSTDPIGTIKANVIGTDYLLQHTAKNPNARFVFLSSVEIYGEDKEDSGSFSEESLGYLDCNQIRAGYPEGKRLGESLCCAYGKQYGVDFVIPRLCRVYGPTMQRDDSKALAQFIQKAAAGEDIILKSTGQQFFSYIHVLDAVRAILYIMLRGNRGEAYNVSSELSNIKLIHLAEKLSGIVGTSVIYKQPDNAEKQGYSKATRAILDNRKLLTLGWKEWYDIDTGLQKTLQVIGESKKSGRQKN